MEVYESCDKELWIKKSSKTMKNFRLFDDLMLISKQYNKNIEKTFIIMKHIYNYLDPNRFLFLWHTKLHNLSVHQVNIFLDKFHKGEKFSKFDIFMDVVLISEINVYIILDDFMTNILSNNLDSQTFKCIEVQKGIIIYTTELLKLWWSKYIKEKLLKKGKLLIINDTIRQVYEQSFSKKPQTLDKIEYFQFFRDLSEKYASSKIVLSVSNSVYNEYFAYEKWRMDSI